MAVQTLRPFFSQTGTTQALLFGQVGTETALLITGYGPQVANLVEVLKLVDVPPEMPDQEVKVVPLEHVSAEELEPILTEILGERARIAQQAAVGASGGAIQPSGPGGLKVLAHGNLDAIVLSGTREEVLEAMNIVAKLDLPAEVDDSDTHVIRMRNVLAKELRDVLNQFIQEDLTAQQAAQAGQQVAAPGGRRPRKTVVVAHEASNSLLLSGATSKVDSLKRTIEKLDTRQPQVLIEAALVELTTGDQVRFGIELGLLDIAQDDFTRPFGFTSFGQSTFQDTDDNGLPDSRLPDLENPLQGFTGGIIADDDFAIPVLLTALAADDSSNILSMPSVVVNNNETAVVSSQEERPTQNTNQGNATTQSGFGGFQGAGIELSISPSISSNNYLRLNIQLMVSRFVSTFDPASVTPGVKLTRQVKTQVTMPSGATMVLGGVIEDTEREEDRGVPFLKDIPLLGWLFRSYNRTKSKTNLYFFLTPHILDEEDFSDLAEVSFRRKMDAARYIGHKRVQIIDSRWREPTPETLEDTGATVEDLDRYGGFEIPFYKRPTGDQQPPLPPSDAPNARGRTPAR
jgi:general secretion pathway protein D